MSLKIKHNQSAKGDTKQRSLIKALTWRVIATLDTVIISFFLIGNIGIAISIGVVETVAKIGVYFVHERVWNAVKNKSKKENLLSVDATDSKRKSIAKSITWSLIGAIITMAAAYVLSVEIKTAVAIGVIEIFTRLIIYFLHERVWNKVTWGKQTIKNEK